MNNEKPLNTTTIIIADSDLRLYRPDLQTSMRSQLTLTVFSITWQKQQNDNLFLLVLHTETTA